jgi:hypothetical protein
MISLHTPHTHWVSTLLTRGVHLLDFLHQSMVPVYTAVYLTYGQPACRPARRNNKPTWASTRARLDTRPATLPRRRWPLKPARRHRHITLRRRAGSQRQEVSCQRRERVEEIAKLRSRERRQQLARTVTVQAAY